MSCLCNEVRFSEGSLRLPASRSPRFGCAQASSFHRAARQVGKRWASQAKRRRVRPNPSVNRTRYGRQRKADAQRLRHCRAPALRRLPPRAGYLER